MKNLITITPENVNMFPFDNESEQNIKCYLDDNILNNMSRFQYAYDPENNKVYSRHLVRNTPRKEWEEDSSVKFNNN